MATDVHPEGAAEVEVAKRRASVGQKPQPALGRRLKALRVSRGLSLKEVAAETGLSSSFISMVETGRNEMTVGRLVTMADFFEVGLGDLVPEREMEQPVIMRRGDRLAVDSEDGRVRSEALASWHHGEMASGLVRLEVGGGLDDLVTQAGPKFIFLLSGELAIEFSDDASVTLQEGDSVWFEASRRHRLRNIGEGEAQLVTFRSAPRSEKE